MLGSVKQSNVFSGAGIEARMSKDKRVHFFSVWSDSLRKIRDWCTVMFVRQTEKEVWEGEVRTQQRVPGLFTWKQRTDTASLSPLLVPIQLESPPVPRGRLSSWQRGEYDSVFLPGVWLWTDSRRHESNRWHQYKYKILRISTVSDLQMFHTHVFFFFCPCSRQISRETKLFKNLSLGRQSWFQHRSQPESSADLKPEVSSWSLSLTNRNDWDLGQPFSKILRVDIMLISLLCALIPVPGAPPLRAEGPSKHRAQCQQPTILTGTCEHVSFYIRIKWLC